MQNFGTIVFGFQNLVEGGDLPLKTPDPIEKLFSMSRDMGHCIGYPGILLLQNQF
jgi:hypothetical protein